LCHVNLFIFPSYVRNTLGFSNHDDFDVYKSYDPKGIGDILFKTGHSIKCSQVKIITLIPDENKTTTLKSILPDFTSDPQDMEHLEDIRKSTNTILELMKGSDKGVVETLKMAMVPVMQRKGSVRTHTHETIVKL
jgi:hypothetical protein